METKKCTACLEDKIITNFFKKPNNKEGYLSICKSCHSEKSRIYREKNKDRLKIYKKGYREVNKDKILQYEKEYRESLDKNVISEYNKEWQKNNKEYCKEYKKKYYRDNKDYFKEKQKNYALNNKEKIKNRNNNYKDTRNLIRNYRRKNDILFSLESKIRSLYYSSFKRAGFSKNSRTFEILGCTYEYFKLHLESKFESWMTWENRGLYNGNYNYGWDIDHIIPISSAKTEAELIKLNHFTNLTPLCSKINRDIKRNIY